MGGDFGDCHFGILGDEFLDLGQAVLDDQLLERHARLHLEGHREAALVEVKVLGEVLGLTAVGLVKDVCHGIHQA